MPQVSPPPDHNDNSPEDYPPLTNQGAFCYPFQKTSVANIRAADVAILYQIIATAEQDPNVATLPYRATFAAYDQVLAQNGLDPDHDQVYLRFLLRMGDKKQSTQSLYERFELLLEELGIQLEFSQGEDGIQDITRTFIVDGTDLATSVHSNGASARRGDTRRASFHGTDTENTGADRSRAHSRASSSYHHKTPRLLSRERPATRASTRYTEKTHERWSTVQPSTALPKRGRLTAQEFASNLQHYQKRNASITSNIYQGNRNIALSNGIFETDTNQACPYSFKEDSFVDGSVEQSENGTSEITHSAQLPYVLDPRELLYRPSETQLLRDAETFQHYQINAIARRIIKKWRSAALQAEQHHKQCEVVAIDYDAGILLRQGFEQWRGRLHDKGQITETERFYGHLEHRAAKARDLFLITKAFTHWAQCAHEEALRTSITRGHVLRLRYFNAWREITAVNELKVRRQGLRKCLAIWKRRYVATQIHEANASSSYDETLLKTAYWGWFWAFCQRRAPQWRAAQLKARYLTLWITRARLFENNQLDFFASRSKRNKRVVFEQWISKTRTLTSTSQQAAAFNERHLITQLLTKWKLIRQLSPLAQQVSNMVDWRVAGSTFATFVFRYRVERHAEAVNRLRTLRKAWTEWNDQLRWQTLAQQIGDRFMLEALYKWVLAERSALLQRLHARRLKQRMLLKILNRLSSIRAERHNRYQILMQACNARRSNLAIGLWRSHLEAHHQSERTASELYASRIAHEALQSWEARLATIRRIQSWQSNLRFSSLAIKIFSCWRAAVTQSRRKKRRNAYAQFRRKLKIDLVNEVFIRWRSLTSQALESDKDARLVYEGRLLQLASSLFDTWRIRWESARDQEHQADDHYQRKLAYQYLGGWLERLRTHRQLEERAHQYAQLRIESIAFGWLHKSRLQMIEHKGRSGNADSLRGMYDRRHIHNILRRWHSKTTALRGHPQPDWITSTRSKRLGFRTEGDDIANRAENWTAFDEGFDLDEWIPPLESSTTPLPGYMSTPSKRAARAKALVRVSTTPAGTPFQRRLRSRPSTEPRPGRQSGLGRSVAFKPILEDEPRTPGR